ncbi:MAG: hypothetical protein AAF394_02205 [Planctomycetota bacterium]
MLAPNEQTRIEALESRVSKLEDLQLALMDKFAVVTNMNAEYIQQCNDHMMLAKQRIDQLCERMDSCEETIF